MHIHTFHFFLLLQQFCVCFSLFSTTYDVQQKLSTTKKWEWERGEQGCDVQRCMRSLSLYQPNKFSTQNWVKLVEAKSVWKKEIGRKLFIRSFSSTSHPNYSLWQKVSDLSCEDIDSYVRYYRWKVVYKFTNSGLRVCVWVQEPDSTECVYE